MIKNITALPHTKEYCDICKKACNIDERFPYLITSTENNKENIVICKACLDSALFEQNILPEEF